MDLATAKFIGLYIQMIPPFNELISVDILTNIVRSCAFKETCR